MNSGSDRFIRTIAIAALIALLSGDAGAGQDEVVELTGGRWFDGKTFVERTVYVSDSLFVSDPGESAVRRVDLGGRYIVPPYADAHSHNLSGEPRWPEIHETYLSEGTFYVLVMHNATSGAAPIRDRLREPGTVDVAYGGAAVTSTLGYPFLRYEPRAMGLNDPATWPDNAAAIRRSRLMENDGYVFIDSTADVESKLGEVLAQRASHLKIILFDAERFAEQSADTQRIGHRGLDPALVPDIVARAHAADVRVIAHIETPYDFRLAVDAGVDVIAHVPGYNLARDADPAAFRLSAETARRAAERGIAVTPTVFAHRVVTDGEWARRRYEVLHHNLTLLKEHGVTVAPGTDVYGVTARPEIEELARFDIWTHAELLAMWSTAGPRVVFPDRRIGVLEPGYEASFLALDCDPMANLACTHRIALRFMDGRFLEPRGPD